MNDIVFMAVTAGFLIGGRRYVNRWKTNQA